MKLIIDIPEKDYNSLGYENYALLHEYGVDGKNTLTYKSAIKRIMRGECKIFSSFML